MEVRDGYKETEVGLIPEEWEAVPISALCDGVLDCDHSTPLWTDSGFIVVRNQNIRDGRLNLEDASFTDESHYKSRTRRAIPKYGDIIITREAPMGLACAVPENLKCCLGQRMVLLQVKSKSFNSPYVLHSILGLTVQDQITAGGGAGSTVSNLRIPVLKQIKIPLPPLPEQQAIASALSDTDDLIAGLEALIAKKQAIKQGAMQELLTGRKRLPGFKGEWEERRLGDLLNFQVGFPFKSEFFSDDSVGIRLIRNRDLTSDGDRIHYTGKYSETYLIDKGDLLIGMDGEFSVCKWKHSKALLNQRIGRILPIRDIDLNFLSYRIVRKLKEIEEITAATTVKHLSHRDIEEIIMHLPDLPEQQAISSILSDMDSEIAQLENQLSKTRALKQGMMQELLTGRLTA